MYISGPYDSPDRIRSILNKLQRLGPDNHSFAVGIDDSLRRSLMLDTNPSQLQASEELNDVEENKLIKAPQRSEST
jgi:hypothetical protein